MHRMTDPRLREIVVELELTIPCDCQTFAHRVMAQRERATGHLFTCPIHINALRLRNEERERDGK